MKKKFLSVLMVALSTMGLASCDPGEEPVELTATQQIIKEAEGLSLRELCVKAIEESNGKKFYGVGNSSRGKKALPKFIAYLQTIDSTYTMDFDWQQPKNNKIFDQLTADSKKEVGTFAMTLIQDGNQIESKMVQTGVLDTFIPKDWAVANKTTADEFEGYLPLQTLNKVFMFNNKGNKGFDNCWDFVDPDNHSLFMDIDSEIVGKNFLYMLTQDKYADMLKEAYDKLPAAEQSKYSATVADLQQTAKDFGLGQNGAYALAWIKLWVGGYKAETDDGPICNTLTANTAVDQSGLLVYSKLRSINESDTVSKNNITVAAYQQGEALYNGVKYEGIGGYAYCHYLFVTENSPLPWTACAFIAYMTCLNTDKSEKSEQVDGFSAWGADMGGYSSNPDVLKVNEEVYNHKTAGSAAKNDGVEFDCKNDRGYEWWTSTGKLVVEDPKYCASVAFTVGSWIELLDKYAG